MKVRIDAGGREVEIECADINMSPRELAAEALAIWRCTDGAAAPSPGPGFGLTGSEIALERSASSAAPMGMEIAQ